MTRGRRTYWSGAGTAGVLEWRGGGGRNGATRGRRAYWNDAVTTAVLGEVTTTVVLGDAAQLAL